MPECDGWNATYWPASRRAGSPATSATHSPPLPVANTTVLSSGETDPTLMSSNDGHRSRDAATRTNAIKPASRRVFLDLTILRSDPQVFAAATGKPSPWRCESTPRRSR
jgi:hypothetical protein